MFYLDLENASALASSIVSPVMSADALSAAFKPAQKAGRQGRAVSSAAVA